MYAAESESRDSDTMAMWTWDEEDSEWFSPQPFAGGCSQEGEEEEERVAKAVIHPFGRGKFRTMAEHVVIPPMVIDAILKGKGRDSPWTWPAEQEQEVRPPPQPKIKPTRPKCTEKMGGVKNPALSPSCHSGGRGMGRRRVEGSTTLSTSASPRLKPKVSGRGRALKMRAERYGNPLRRPGRLVSESSTWLLCLCVCHIMCVCAERVYK